MTTRAQIVEEARTWIGTRYRHQARRKGVAVDCIGLVGGVALACGVPNAAEWERDTDLHCYARTPDPALLMAACERFFDKVPARSAQAGDVLLFALQEQPRHFAIVVQSEPARVVHAYALLSARRVVEQPLPIAHARVLAAFQYKGIDA